jgi:hypothetical protein
MTCQDLKKWKEKISAADPDVCGGNDAVMML